MTNPDLETLLKIRQYLDVVRFGVLPVQTSDEMDELMEVRIGLEKMIDLYEQNERASAEYHANAQRQSCELCDAWQRTNDYLKFVLNSDEIHDGMGQEDWDNLIYNIEGALADLEHVPTEQCSDVYIESYAENLWNEDEPWC